MAKDYYRILRVPPTASPAEIRQAYKLLIKFFHPDHHQQDTAKKIIAEEETKELNEAFEVLRDATRRAHFDLERQQHSAGTSQKPQWGQADQKLQALQSELVAARKEIDRLAILAANKSAELRSARSKLGAQTHKITTLEAVAKELTQEVETSLKQVGLLEGQIKTLQEQVSTQATSFQEHLSRRTEYFQRQSTKQAAQLAQLTGIVETQGYQLRDYQRARRLNAVLGLSTLLSWFIAAVFIFAFVSAIATAAKATKIMDQSSYSESDTLIETTSSAPSGDLTLQSDTGPANSQPADRVAIDSATAVPSIRATATRLASAPVIAHATTTATSQSSSPSIAGANSLQITASPTSVPLVSIESPEGQSGHVLSRGVNVRSGPGLNFPVQGFLDSGTFIRVTGKDKAAPDWLQIRVDAGYQWVSARTDLTVVEELSAVPVVAVPTPPTAIAVPTPVETTTESAGQWVLVADSIADFPSVVERKWWYVWTSGRNNFRWQDMGFDGTCYRSPNDWGLAVCRDSMSADGRGDVALLYKAQQGGKYRFDWEANGGVGFYKHLDGLQGGTSGSVVVDNVIDWELFFFVASGSSSSLSVRVYLWQEL